MIDKLYFYYWKTWNTFYSLNLGLKGFCNAFGIEYESIPLSPNCTNIDMMPSTNDNMVVFFFNDHARSDIHFKSLRAKCPNAITVQLGTDTQYQGYGDIKLTDFHLDLMEEYVEQANSEGTPSELLWWTVSRQICQFIPEQRSYKPFDFICLCKEECTYERRMFFNTLRDKYIVSGDYKWFHIQKLMKQYSLTKTTLGITHSPHDGNKTRGMKGFRDWLGPLCGSPLIYDDHPQMFKYFWDIIPFYEFNEAESIPEALNEIDANTVERQQNWIYNNFIEDQLERIFKKWNIV